MSENRELEKSVQAALERAPGVNVHRYPLDIAAEGGVVTLSGTVENIIAKRRAVMAAATVPGAREVIDGLQVEPAEAMGEDEVLVHVRDALFEEPALADYRLLTINKKGEETVVRDPAAAAGDIIVTVEAPGKVILGGTVGSLSHRRLAELLAWWVPGTTDVVNDLRVQPAEEDNDGEILDSVRIALEKDHLVDAGNVTLTCRDGVVTLAGSIPTGKQKLLAESDAWYVAGVRDVINELQAVDPA